MVETDIQRYNRQELIDGWDQSKLKNATVTIVGSGPIGQQTALPLAALGVGNIRIIDTAKGEENDQLLDLSLRGDARVKSLEEKLQIINPEVKVRGIVSEMTTLGAQYFLANSNVIIDATNDPRSKVCVLDYVTKKRSRFISASGNSYEGKVVYGNNMDDARMLLTMYADQQQDDLVALTLGGFIAEEVKKLLMQKGGVMKQVFSLNFSSDQRFGHRSDHDIVGSPQDFEGKNVLLVGAGALGCFLGPATVRSLRPARLDVMDFDVVEPHNLNRQVCYYDAVGQLKAVSLADKLKKMNGNVDVRAINARFTPEFSASVKYDLIFDAVDSFFAKAIVHEYAKRHKIPLISGGTDIRAMTVLSYVPGVTSCFDCQINLRALGIKTEIIRRTTCTQAPDPSVIMTNQVAGGMMVGEARRVLRPDVYGHPLNGEIRYITDADSRGGINVFDKVCRCHTKKVVPLELPSPKKVKVVEKDVEGKVVKQVYVNGVLI